MTTPVNIFIEELNNQLALLALPAVKPYKNEFEADWDPIAPSFFYRIQALNNLKAFGNEPYQISINIVLTLLVNDEQHLNIFHIALFNTLKNSNKANWQGTMFLEYLAGNTLFDTRITLYE